MQLKDKKENQNKKIIILQKKKTNIMRCKSFGAMILTMLPTKKKLLYMHI